MNYTLTSTTGRIALATFCCVTSCLKEEQKAVMHVSFYLWQYKPPKAYYLHMV